MAEVLFRARLQRDEAKSAWGFRLQGGTDFCRPLTLLSVTPESIASKGGLEAGDIIVKIAGKATECMTHKDAQEAIIESSNLLEIIVERAEATITSPVSSPTGVLSPQGSASPPPGEAASELLHPRELASTPNNNQRDHNSTNVEELSVRLNKFTTEQDVKYKQRTEKKSNSVSKNIPIKRLERLSLSEHDRRQRLVTQKIQQATTPITSPIDSSQSSSARYINRHGTGFYDPAADTVSSLQRRPSPPSPPPDIMAQDYEILRQISVKQLKSRFNVDDDTSQRLATAFMADRYGPPPSLRNYTPNLTPPHWRSSVSHSLSSSPSSHTSSTLPHFSSTQMTPSYQKAVDLLTERDALLKQWEKYKKTGAIEDKPLRTVSWNNQRRMSQQRRVHFSDNLEHVREIESRRDPNYHNPSILDELGLHEIEVDLETYANPPPQSRSLKVLDAGITETSEPPSGSLTRLYRTITPPMAPPRPSSPITTPPPMMNSIGASQRWSPSPPPQMPNNTIPSLTNNPPTLPPGIFAFFDKSFMERFLQYESERAFTEKFMQWQHEREQKGPQKSETLRMVQEMDFRKQHPPWTDL